MAKDGVVQAGSVVGGRGAAPDPARGKPPETPAPFPFPTIFQNGPRRPGCAPENLFKITKDFPPPLRALDRSGPFRKLLLYKGKGAYGKALLLPPFGRPDICEDASEKNT